MFNRNVDKKLFVRQDWVKHSPKRIPASSTSAITLVSNLYVLIDKLVYKIIMFFLTNFQCRESETLITFFLLRWWNLFYVTKYYFDSNFDYYCDVKSFYFILIVFGWITCWLLRLKSLNSYVDKPWTRHKLTQSLWVWSELNIFIKYQQDLCSFSSVVDSEVDDWISNSLFFSFQLCLFN